MELNVSEALRNPGQEYRFDGEQEIAPVDVLGEEVRFDNTRLAGTFFTGSDGSVTVDGELSATAHTRCANCLKPASTEIRIPFRETFRRDGDPEDDEQFAYTSSVVRFEKLAMSYAVLALPMRILCRADCPGMSDVDSEAHGFTLLAEEPPKGQRPFAALGKLLEQDSAADE